MLVGIAGTFFSACYVGLPVFRKLCFATFFTRLAGFSISRFISREFKETTTRTRQYSKTMWPTCLAVITVLKVGLKSR
jgi:hypothetical protein